MIRAGVIENRDSRDRREKKKGDEEQQRKQEEKSDIYVF